MPRIRTIKPEFFSSPGVEGMSPWARLLYIAMWNFADDAGRGSALPRELAGFAFPRDNFDSADIRRILGEVRRGFGVTFYKVNGRPYYCIPTWSKHQKIDKRSTPKYPAPDDGQEYAPEAGTHSDTPVDQPEHDDSEKSTEDSTEPAEDPPNTRRSLGAGNRNRGTEEQGKKTKTCSRRGVNEPPPRFDEFWSHYPRKDAKQTAITAWRKAVPRYGADELINQIRRWRELWESAGTEKNFIPHAATWLNNERWRDEPPTTRLRAISGGHTPYQNPADPRRAYTEGWS